MFFEVELPLRCRPKAMTSKWRYIAAYGMAVVYAFVFVAGWSLHQDTAHRLGRDGAECAWCESCDEGSDHRLQTAHSREDGEHRPDLGDRAPAKRHHGGECRICRFLAQNFAPVVPPIHVVLSSLERRLSPIVLSGSAKRLLLCYYERGPPCDA